MTDVPLISFEKPLSREELPPDGKPCRGLVFRGRVNAFVNNRGEYVYKESMRPLKRLSCPGCVKCGWLVEGLKEYLAEGMQPNIDSIDDQALYELVITNVSTDWETGYVDDWDLEFRRKKEINVADATAI